jgi:acetyltransferase-like isoleucine patch superfamily enzyme
VKVFLQKGLFVLRYRYHSLILGYFRKFLFSLVGMRVGQGTLLPKVYISWPHQIQIGNSCQLEHNIYLKYDGVWKRGPSIIINDRVFIGSGCEFNIRKGLIIGSDCLIASGCRFIDHDHGMRLGQLMGPQPGQEKEIKIGRDVWLGCNVVVLKGVEIGDGAVVAAGAVVTHSILSNEIWAGVPAKKLGERK